MTFSLGLTGTNTYQLNYFKYFQLIKTYQNIFGKDKVKVMLFENLFNLDYLKNMLDDFGVNTLGIDKVDFRSYNKTYSPLSSKITPIINRFLVPSNTWCYIW